jgi:phosphoribosylanthranilate isomerase
MIRGLGCGCTRIIEADADDPFRTDRRDNRVTLIAGGLNAANIPELLSRCQPAGVDLNSGVEERPGIKDAHKLHAALDAIRQHTFK